MIRNRVISILTDDLSEHKQLVEKFNLELSRLPEGSLCLRKIRGANRFYHYIPSSSADIPATLTYISKSNEDLKKALARRKFIEESLDVLESNIELLRTLLDTYITYDPTAIMEKLPKSYQGIDCSGTFGLLKTNDPSEWINEPFEKNPKYHEGLTCKSTLGLSVRSKSESIIASQLEINNIPFRYEAALQLDDRVFYPDFTILNPQDNRVIYWEHFGMIDDVEYARQKDKKLMEYRKYGIYEGDNLITTNETRKSPLSSQTIHRIIKSYLLQDGIHAS
ncbi:MAG: hypothetical protein GXX92_08355 [Clostridiales bacterium]|nr:hypothetical protein [Clostridiales bacterium]